MMTPKTVSLFLGLAFLLSTPAARAAGASRLTCEADTFETPMTLNLQGGEASASVSWDMTGSAIIEADYRGLAVIDVNGELTVTEPVVAGRRPAFHVTLRPDRGGRLTGRLFVRATDGSDLTFTGTVTCTR